jgi:pilus assembly protein CpaF
MEVNMRAKVTPQDIFPIAAPLDPLLSDPGITEIMIDRYDRVLVVTHENRLEQVASPFAAPEELQALIDGLFGLYGIRLDADHPVGELHLPDHSRATAVVPPNAVEGPHLVLRRMPQPYLTWDKLIEWQSVAQGAYDLIRSALAARANILIAGGTASGKTTVANMIADLCPPEERLIVIEQVYEMQIQHPRVLRLEAGGPSGLSIEDLLAAATHMGPDRLIVGELAGPAAAAVLQHFGSGYDGSLATIHGKSLANALDRLESYCLMADLGLGLAEIRTLIASGVQLITYQERMPDGSRKLVDMVELRGVENQRYVLQPLMRYDREAGQFEFTGITPTWER